MYGLDGRIHSRDAAARHPVVPLCAPVRGGQQLRHGRPGRSKALVFGESRLTWSSLYLSMDLHGGGNGRPPTGVAALPHAQDTSVVPRGLDLEHPS